MTALAPYRVLDLTIERGWMCARLLADLGAEVIKVEPPGGDPGRRKGLFVNPLRPDPEESLSWWFENRGKSSVVLDLDDDAGRDQLLRLVDSADALIESFDGGWLDARRLSIDFLLARNPRLVVTSISPFGRLGPHAHWSATDLTVAASTGVMWLTGDTDRAPVRVSAPQLFLHAGAEAAVHTLVALIYAQDSGIGQHVDVSAQLCGVRCLMDAPAYHLLEGRELNRVGPFNTIGRSYFRMINPSRDGYVVNTVVTGAVGAPSMRYLMDLAESEGVADPQVSTRDFSKVDFLGESDEFFAGVRLTLERLFARHTKGDLYQTAIERSLFLAPVQSVADIRTDAQLAARGYFVRIDPHQGASPLWAGPWARLSATPLLNSRPAPHVGQHNAEISTGEHRPRHAPAPACERSQEHRRPFEGLKVVDLSWVGVGPLTTGYLAAYGATVVKIESETRPDILRINPPFRDGEPGINNSHFFGDFNAGKLSVGLKLSDPRGRELAWRAIEWADVVVESFTPKALAAWEMDYGQIRRRNPAVIMLSTCLQGQTGPRRLYRGFGNMASALAGLIGLTGWPDRPPTMIYGAPTDFIAQRFAATALLAALDYRRRTGIGQHIDLSQLEASLQFLGPELLAHEIDGRVSTRAGNRDRDIVPNGVFPCLPEPDRIARFPEGGIGAEAWTALSCVDDTQWTTLVSIAGLPDKRRWATVAGRRADEDHIEELIASWTAVHRAGEITALLQPDVACAPVLGVPELHEDPQINFRGYWVPIEHPVYGKVPHSGMQASMSHTPGIVDAPAPCLGQHSREVLEGILGIARETITALLIEGIVEITG